jgi:anti-sigma-K factor RskA
LNIQEYIQSGVVELYVAGALCEEDARELESLAQQYPELKKEIEQVELALEAYAFASQTEPDAALKAKILSAVKMNPTAPKEQPSATPETHTQELDEEIRPLPVARTNWLAIAAAVVLLLVSGAIGYNFYQKSRQLESQITALRNETNQQQTLIKSILIDPNYQSVLLKGNEKLPMKMPDAEIKVFWNAETKQVHVSVGKLPELGEDQQYQLWALKDDQPIDAGVFEVNAGGIVQPLKTIAAADKWAVTIEPKGGSQQPHLDKLCLLSAG